MKRKTAKYATKFAPKKNGVMSLWVMTPFGFIAPSLRKNVPEGDPRTIQVRSRRRETLDALRDRWLLELSEIDEQAGTDYQYRAYCTHLELAKAMARMVMAIDDPSFKALAGGQGGLADRGLARKTGDMYHAVWETVLKHGDGKSVYDNWGSSSTLSGIAACRRWGHLWPAGSVKCKDCGEPNPVAPHKYNGPTVYAPPAKVYWELYPGAPAALPHEGYGECWDCGRWYLLRTDGRIRAHKTLRGARCTGSGEDPA